MGRERPLLKMLEKVTGEKVGTLYGQVTDVPDASRDITVALAAFPSITITSVEAPTSARPGETITVKVHYRNDGGDGTSWDWAYDIDTSEVLYPRGEAPCPIGAIGTATFYPIMPSTRDLRIRYEIGHVE